MTHNTTPIMGRCGGVIDETTTREELLARGFTPAAADEVLAFRDQLVARGKRGAA